MGKRSNFCVFTLQILAITLGVAGYCYATRRRATNRKLLPGGESDAHVGSARGGFEHQADEAGEGHSRHAMKGLPPEPATLPAHLRDWGDEAGGITELAPEDGNLSDRPPPPWRFPQR